jgi:D-aminopeptidase
VADHPCAVCDLGHELTRNSLVEKSGTGVPPVNHAQDARATTRKPPARSKMKKSTNGFLAFSFLILFSFIPAPAVSNTQEARRPRAREAGVIVGILPTGPLNAITDVKGVAVGHSTLVSGDNVRTGVTAILPHTENLFREKVPAAIFIGNAFGKLAGSTQVNELGEIETPIMLTSTLNVPRVADALMDYMLALPGNQDVQSINPLVGETNDGYLNDIRKRSVGREEVFAAIRSARGGAVEEGSVGAGTGTVAFGFKGGIGTSSRKLPATLGGYTVGVLVQSNFGGILTINGAPVGLELGRYYLKGELSRADAGLCKPGSKSSTDLTLCQPADGSIMIVIATDAPVDHRNLRRLAARSMMGLARTGAAGSNGSGDYAIAFSAAPELRIRTNAGGKNPRPNVAVLANDAMSPLFLAVIEATEEAIYNSLFRATTTNARGHTVEALPLDRTLEILRRHKALN